VSRFLCTSQSQIKGINNNSIQTLLRQTGWTQDLQGQVNITFWFSFIFRNVLTSFNVQLIILYFMLATWGKIGAFTACIIIHKKNSVKEWDKRYGNESKFVLSSKNVALQQNTLKSSYIFFHCFCGIFWYWFIWWCKMGIQHACIHTPLLIELSKGSKETFRIYPFIIQGVYIIWMNEYFVLSFFFLFPTYMWFWFCAHLANGNWCLVNILFCCFCTCRRMREDIIQWPTMENWI